ncbi:protein archease [Candidatus Pacearchaeota archaeon]|nr:protein archease [Candidatus Pacearchaeota archaeon]
MKFKFLPHTADIKFQAFGNSLEEVFENAAYALANIISRDKIKPKEKKIIKVRARDSESLLYDFLEEFLYLIDVGGFILSEIKNLKITSSSSVKNNKTLYNSELIAEVLGDSIENYNIEKDVKAITYNDMFIKKEKEKFICQVVVDV